MDLKNRIRLFLNKIKQHKLSVSLLVSLAIAYSIFLYYQTQIKNHYSSYKDLLEQRAYYEKKFKKWKDYPRPSIVHADYKIHLFGKERRYSVEAMLMLVNKSDIPIDSLLITVSKKFPFKPEIPNTSITWEDHHSNVTILCYHFQKPFHPGDTLTMKYSLEPYYEGIENEISNVRLVPNGTFINNESFTPFFGYNEENELSDKSDRKKKGLPLKDQHYPPLKRNCTNECMQNYLGANADWATIHAVISTDSDQMAIAPGSLIRQWKENNRNYFEYDLRQPSLFFFNVVSGNYKVKTETYKNIRCEVYYYPHHPFNVDEMMKALKLSIDFCSTRYTPYRHKEARIIEFPGFASFAQAYPGTMPYSESIGFTRDLSHHPKDINRIFHVVTHEMAHQWWAHQVIGAKMQGAPFLSESMAEFSSLLLLEKEYGKDMTARFLREAVRNYLSGRASESEREPSVITTDIQSYVYYNKASVCLYSLFQLLGQEKVFTAIREFADTFAYREPPYPTAHHLMDKFYALTPDSLKNTIRSLFEEITIFDATIHSAQSRKIHDSLYEVSVQFSVKKEKFNPEAKVREKIEETEIGKGTEVTPDDYIPVAAYTQDESAFYGKEIFRQFYHLTRHKNNIVFYTKVKPDKIVIDPFYIHIWKDALQKEKKI